MHNVHHGVKVDGLGFNPISPRLFFLGGVKTQGGTTLYHTPITFEQEPLEG